MTTAARPGPRDAGPGPAATTGSLLRAWRERRRLSQLALALDADVSARHLSFLETGRARPSREMLLRLSERLAIPLRDRNALLLGAGFAPLYPERPLAHDALAAVRAAVDRLLAAHEPYPALAVDRRWDLVATNHAIPPLLAGVHPSLLAPPANVLRLGLSPDGLAPRIANLPEWRAHLLGRLRRDAEATADPDLLALHAELAALPAPAGASAARPGSATTAHPEAARVAVPLRLETEHGTLSLLSATTVFGTPVDVTVAELAVESFFPADAATADALRRLCPPAPGADTRAAPG